MDKADWLTVQQIIKEKRYAKHRRARSIRPRYVVKDSLSGFFIVDPTWTEEDVDALYKKLCSKTEPPAQPAEYENFITIKE